ncbi:hypothetical protein GCM10009554_35140 [Kribbella koreensis]|uniref:Peptidase inhibitor family I36 n=1 Tax=Kribbella koreensis TaxID=57909 RepID=A0ABN1QHM4_9ACTN
MNKMIKRGIAGVGALGAAGGVLFGALPSDAATGAAASQPGPLHSSQLKYVTHTWACDSDAGLDGRACQVGAEVPKGWAWTKVDRYQARFDKSNLWMVRIDGYLPNAGSTTAMAKAKQKALRGTAGLKVLSVKSSSLPNTVTKSRIYFTTVTYTYRDATRGIRWVATRYADPMDHGAGAQEELTVSGRPQDAGALGVVLNRATQTVALAG